MMNAQMYQAPCSKKKQSNGLYMSPQ